MSLKHIVKTTLSVLSAAFFVGQNTHAQDNPLLINGYSTIGYSQIIPSNQSTTIKLGVLNDRGTFRRDSIFGLNLIYLYSDQITFYGQLVARGSDFSTNEARDYRMSADMFFLSYRPFEWLDLKVGRQIAPLWMVSEQIDVGLTYLWIRPPLEVYQLAPMKNLIGVGFNVNYNLMGVDLLGGARYGEASPPADAFEYVNLRNAFVAFGEASYLGKFKLRASYGSTTAHSEVKNAAILKSQTQSSLGGASAYTPDTSGLSVDNQYYITQFKFSSVGFNMDWENILLTAEYAVNAQQQKMLNPKTIGNFTAGAERVKTDLKSYYVTAGYRWDIFTPHFTFAKSNKRYSGFDFSNYFRANSALGGVVGPSNANTFINTVTGLVARANYANSQQTTMTAGLNISLTPQIVSKFEYQRTLAKNGDHAIIIGPTLKKDKKLDIISTALSFAF